jgi:steroid 5-alpha reductase family enzyme
MNMGEGAKEWARAGAVVAVTAVVLFGIAWLLAPSSIALHGVPVPFFLAAIALGLNWIVFLPAALLATERFYDLTGSLTFLLVAAVSLVAAATAGTLDLPGILVGVAVAAWAIRLGWFLVGRIHRTGKDGRFDEMKRVPARFLVAWTLQGLWVFLTLLAAFTFITARSRPAGMTLAFGLGLLVWAAGFAVEVVADCQKAAFAANANNRGRFIRSGLWGRSRHPNYFGEIVLWTGLFIAGLDVWRGVQWITVLSPVFVAVLLTRVSGIPMLEARAEERWGSDPDYQAYKAKTPVLIPRPR